MSNYVPDSVEHFRRNGIDPDAYFVIHTERGSYAHAAPSAEEAIRLLIEQHPEIDPLDCRVKSLREHFEQAASYEHLRQDEQGRAMLFDSLAETVRRLQERAKKGSAP